MKTKLDLNAMMTFCKVAENSSFTTAAETLGVKKSTVSNKVSELERSLGAKLLYRNTRHVALTEIGQDYFKYCQEIVQKAEEANQFITTFNTEPQGILKLVLPPGLGRIIFDELFTVFLEKYPKVKLDVNLTLEPIDIIKESYDASLLVADATLKDSNLIAKKLFDVHLGFYATRSYLAKQSPIRTLKDMEAHELIQAYSNTPPIIEDGKELHIVSNNRVRINYLDACIKAVQKDLGVGLLPNIAVTRELESGSLVEVLPECQIAPKSIFVLYHSRSWLPPKLKVFLEFLEDWRQQYIV